MEETLKFTPQFEKRGGLIPCVAQEVSTGEILMVGSVNEEALKKTLSSGMATFYSTSRQKLWTKGETSGEYLKVHTILTDCDQDALIYQVELMGSGACHTQNSLGQPRKSCFYRKYNDKTGLLEFLSGRE
ncbi:phosphoribosyl-AMP cyclohydrolase [Spirochaeta cellobiosiphila]|uniref:phosphoribosyl-AMP cyclohydrolase n=1 Tax=Spirochaeta cellobiosiphila TaxID=504483 RepID=UPI00040C4712|nr:phosphoribosyl-AMP cyclohydrolase [Spirochaeta cellobiosiphila]